MVLHGADEDLALRIAGEVSADVRTVRKVLRGETVRGRIGKRIAEALDRAARGAPETAE
jgi:hypothetical protein